MATRNFLIILICLLDGQRCPYLLIIPCYLDEWYYDKYEGKRFDINDPYKRSLFDNKFSEYDLDHTNYKTNDGTDDLNKPEFF